MKLLDGQRALITGAGSGIGKAMAQHFEKAGARIWICDADTNNLEQSLKQNSHWNGTPCDVSDENQVDQLFEEMKDSFGGLEILVNNAGILDLQTRVDGMNAERIQRIFAVNVTGSFLCAREAVKRMSTKYGGKGGSIVNLSSGAAKYGSPGEYVDYAASKAAVDTLTIGLAREVAEEGIRVNAVRPGLIDTDMHARSGCLLYTSPSPRDRG